MNDDRHGHRRGPPRRQPAVQQRPFDLCDDAQQLSRSHVRHSISLSLKQRVAAPFPGGGRVRVEPRDTADSAAAARPKARPSPCPLPKKGEGANRVSSILRLVTMLPPLCENRDSGCADWLGRVQTQIIEAESPGQFLDALQVPLQGVEISLRRAAGLACSRPSPSRPRSRWASGRSPPHGRGPGTRSGHAGRATPAPGHARRPRGRRTGR